MKSLLRKSYRKPKMIFNARKKLTYSRTMLIWPNKGFPAKLYSLVH